MKYADYIKQIEIDSLWSGKKHILWTLDPHVNILSGINGVGKSTILNKVFKSVNTGCHACAFRHYPFVGLTHARQRDTEYGGCPYTVSS